MDIQTIIVFLIFLICLFYAVRFFMKKVKRSKGGDCGCGCGCGCGCQGCGIQHDMKKEDDTNK